MTLFPFPGLKIINIRGSALLTLDLIIINHFVTRLQPENQLLELSLRDQVSYIALKTSAKRSKDSTALAVTLNRIIRVNCFSFSVPLVFAHCFPACTSSAQ